MRGPEKIAMAVRKPDGGIHTEVSEVRSHAWRKWPLVRGVCSFVESLVTGYRYLSKSADIALTEEEEELTGPSPALPAARLTATSLARRICGSSLTVKS